MSEDKRSHVLGLWQAAEHEDLPLEELTFALGMQLGPEVSIRIAKASVAALIPSWEARTAGDAYLRSIVELVGAWERGSAPDDQAMFEAMQAHASVAAEHSTDNALFAGKGLINALSGHLHGIAEGEAGAPPPPAPAAELNSGQCAHAVKYAVTALSRQAVWSAVSEALGSP